MRRRRNGVVEELRHLYEKGELLRRFSDEGRLIRYLYEEELLSQGLVSEVLGCSQQSVSKKMQKHGIKARSKAEAGIIAHGRAHLRHDFSGDEREKAHLIGLCKGDLIAEKRYKGGLTVVVRCSSTKEAQIDMFKNVFSPYGYVHVGKPNRERKGEVEVKAYLNLSFSFLINLPDVIPAWILANSNTFFAFLAGYTDAEGCIGVYDGQAIFRLASCDKHILHQIHAGLIKLGIECPEPWISEPRGAITGQGYRRNQDFWYLQIKAKASLMKLFAQIAPYLKHTERIQGMKAAIKNIEERHSRWGTD